MTGIPLSTHTGLTSVSRKLRQKFPEACRYLLQLGFRLAFNGDALRRLLRCKVKYVRAVTQADASFLPSGALLNSPPLCSNRRSITLQSDEPSTANCCNLHASQTSSCFPSFWSSGRRDTGRSSSGPATVRVTHALLLLPLRDLLFFFFSLFPLKDQQQQQQQQPVSFAHAAVVLHPECYYRGRRGQIAQTMIQEEALWKCESPLLFSPPLLPFFTPLRRILTLAFLTVASITHAKTFPTGGGPSESD